MKVRFSAPRDIIVSARWADETVQVSQVTMMLGRVVSSSGDTLSLELADLTRLGRRERYARHHSVSVVRDLSSSVQILNRHPRRTTGIVLGMLVGFLGDVFLIAYASRS